MRCLTPLLPRFRDAFPGLKLELIFTDANLDLVSERIDLAIRLGPSIEADVIGVKLFDTRYGVCAAPSYIAKAPPLAVPADMSRHVCPLFALPDFEVDGYFAIQRAPSARPPCTAIS